MARYSRQDWGARPPRGVTSLPWGRVDTLFIHYTAAESDQTGDPRERMRGTQRYHMDTKGWNDIAYNWAFSKDGDILQGRGWQVYSAATGAENGHSQAIVFLGSDKLGRDDVTGKGREALRLLVNEAMTAAGRPLLVRGHTEAPGAAGATSCPGSELLEYVHAQNLTGWSIKEPAIKYPKQFFLFAAWYLAEGSFAGKQPHDLSIRPASLPGRFTPQTTALTAALKLYVARRKTT